MGPAPWLPNSGIDSASQLEVRVESKKVFHIVGLVVLRIGQSVHSGFGSFRRKLFPSFILRLFRRVGIDYSR